MRARSTLIALTTVIAMAGSSAADDMGWSKAGAIVGYAGAAVSCGLGIAAAGEFDGTKVDPGDPNSDWEYPSAIYVLTPIAGGIDAVSLGVSFAGGKSTRNRTDVNGVVGLRVLGWICGIVSLGEYTVQTILAGSGERIRGTPIILASFVGLLANASFATDDLVTYKQASKKSAAEDVGRPQRFCLSPYIGTNGTGGAAGLALTF